MRLLVGLIGATVLLAHGQEEAGGTDGQEGEAGVGKGDGEKTRKELAEGHSYCEYDNCYELLGVKPESGPIPIKRAYRRHAAEWHPDKCPGGDLEKCRVEFPKYANAYEILSSPEMRKNYDYVLANPYEFPGFFLKYSRPKYAPKSDLRFVFIITLLGAAGAHHFLKRSTYEQALSQMKKNPRARYQERIKEVLSKMPKEPVAPPSPTKKPASDGGKGGKGGKEAEEKKEAKVSKAVLKNEAEERRKKAAEAQVEEEMAAELGITPPTLADNIAVAVFKMPLTLAYSTAWLLNGGLREPAYMTRKALGVSSAEWDMYTEEEQEELTGRELWIADNLEAYEAEMAVSDKGKTKSGKQKREARALKKRGPIAMLPGADD